MYQHTSGEVVNVAVLVLQQDLLWTTIQETLSIVVNSPATLVEISVLFRKLIIE